MRAPRAVPLTLLATAAAGLGYALAEAQAFVLRRVTVPVLPAGHLPLRVLHLSDTHLTPTQTRKQDWVRRLGDLEPDLVVHTGDNLAHPDAVATVLDSYADLLHAPGVFVFGSNDYHGPRLKNPARYLMRDDGTRIHGDDLPTEELREAFLAAGWRDLNNRRDNLALRGLRLTFAGVDDPHLQRDRYLPAPAPDADLAIGVAHAPYTRVLDAMAADGYGLILAGHTHGGQLCVPGYGALVTNCDLPTSMARGLHRWPPGNPAGAWLHVSAGVGTSPYTPVRFACRPEATLLTLVAR